MTTEKQKENALRIETEIAQRLAKYLWDRIQEAYHFEGGINMQKIEQILQIDKLPPVEMSVKEQLEFFKDRAEMCFCNMEGEDAEGFARWEKLYCAYQTIYEDMLAESLLKEQAK